MRIAAKCKADVYSSMDEYFQVACLGKQAHEIVGGH